MISIAVVAAPRSSFPPVELVTLVVAAAAMDPCANDDDGRKGASQSDSFGNWFRPFGLQMVVSIGH